MYKVIKDVGNNSNVAIQNTDTKAEVIIGRLSMTIVSILEKYGHKIGTEDGLKYKDQWDLVIDEDTKDELQRLAMRMMKPKRVKVQAEEKEEKEIQKQQANKTIDAMDVLLGLAKYN